MKQILSLLFAILMVNVLGKKNLKDRVQEKQNDHKTVVESNHFYSNYETFTNYDINNVEKDKSLIFLIKPK